MKTVTSRVTIHASRAVVWAELIDFPAWRQWNPFLKRVDAEPVEGSDLDATGHLPPGVDFTFRGTITAVHEQRKLAWRAEPTLLPGGAFVIVHEFHLSDAERGATVLRQREDMSGWLAPVAAPSSLLPLQVAHGRMNDALKRRIEGS